MPIYGQGDTYEEEEIEDTEETVEESEEADEKPAKQKKSFSVNPKIIGLSCAGVALVLIIGAVLIWSGVQKDKAQQQANADAVFQNLKDQGELQERNPELFEENEETPAEQQPVVKQSSVSYSKKEVEALRLWGYTADEIEISSRDGIPAKTLVDQAKFDRQLAQKEALDAVRDTASPEYQELLNKTWLGGAPLNLDAVDPNVIYNNTSRKMNVDYEKCGAQGSQLFLKLYLDDGTAAFMTVTPNRWKELNDSGNIVVEVTWREAGELRIVTDVHEVRVDQ